MLAVDYIDNFETKAIEAIRGKEKMFEFDKERFINFFAVA